MIQHDNPAIVADCTIVSPDKVLFDGKVTKVMVPGLTQQLAIMPDHTPLYALLKKGSLIINAENGTSSQLEIEGGVIRTRSNTISIITGFATKEELDQNPSSK